MLLSPGSTGANWELLNPQRKGTPLMEEKEKKELQQEQRTEPLQRNVLQNPPLTCPTEIRRNLKAFVVFQ